MDINILVKYSLAYVKAYESLGDVDGGHISALLLRMFIMYCPFLIKAGIVYKAIPPLYSIPNGKKRIYFIDQLDMIKYVQKIFIANNKLSYINNTQLQPKDLTKLFMINNSYVYYLEKTATTYAINKYLLEIVLYNYIRHNDSFDYKSLKKEIKTNYRFMDVYSENGNIIVKGSIEESNFVICNDNFINGCSEIINIIKSNDEIEYIFNGNRCYIYSIMKAYENSMPKNVQRYKGLGEMPKEELAESTLLEENRTLIRYTVDDIKESFNIIREYESNTKKILSLVHNVTRDDLVE